jgi:septal ring factor EnvC (AmiA/AmiB activator)
MSKRVDELEQQVRDLQEELADAEREVLEVSGANGRICAAHDETRAALKRVHDDRDDAWKRITALEQQVTDRDVENAVLAEQNRGLLAVLRAMDAPAEEVPS